MKSLISCLVLIIYILVIGCNNNKAAQENNQASVSKEPKSEEPPPSRGDGIVGGWNLELEAYDDIDNNILDEEERKKGRPNKYNYRFKADGKCTIQKIYDGEYETQNYNGKKILTIYLYDQGKKTFDSKYYVNTLNESELVLLEEGGTHVFWVFKRE